MVRSSSHSFLLVCSALASLLTLASAEQGALTLPEDVAAYDKGKFGGVPTETLRSVDFNVTRISKQKWDSRCDQPDQYYFFNTYGIDPPPPHAGPQIVDSNGTTVWFGDDYREGWTVAPVTYKNEQYLSFWTGNPNVRGRGHGEGVWHLLDKHYNHFTTIEAVGDTPADMHELTITANNTALVIVCKAALRSDLEKLGVRHPTGYVADCYFQELDISTKPATLLFSWRASDHVSLFEAWKRPDEATHYNDTSLAIDWFHLNSVTKDHHGNYLISARHTSAIYYISGVDGHIIWRLGGLRSDFIDAQGSNATHFDRQHHARWQDADESTLISLFDNGPETFDRPSRALLLRLNTTSMTVSLEMELTHPQGYWSESQGSFQHLPGTGNWLVGWGNVGAMTEWDAQGKDVLCDLQIAALHDEQWGGGYSPGRVWAYRSTRAKWLGLPTTAPDVLLDESAMVVKEEKTVDGDVGIPVCSSDAQVSPCWEEFDEPRGTDWTGYSDEEEDDEEHEEHEEEAHLTARYHVPGTAKLFVSWNGATEVRSYEVRSAPLLDLTTPVQEWSWQDRARFSKTGFESEADVGDVKQDRVFKITAYDAENAVLGTWLYVRGEERGQGSTQLMPLDAAFDAEVNAGMPEIAKDYRLQLDGLQRNGYALVAAAIVITGCGAWFFRRRISRSKYIALAQSPIMQYRRRSSAWED